MRWGLVLGRGVGPDQHRQARGQATRRPAQDLPRRVPFRQLLQLRVLPEGHRGLGISVDRGVLSRVADQRRVGERRLALLCAHLRDAGGVEKEEVIPESATLAQNRRPRQPRLEALEADPLEQAGFRDDGSAPFLVEVLPLQLGARGPGRANHAVGADDVAARGRARLAMVVRCVLIHNSPSSLGCAKYWFAARDLCPARLAMHFAVHTRGRSRHRPLLKAEFSPAAGLNHSQTCWSGFSHYRYLRKITPVSMLAEMVFI